MNKTLVVCMLCIGAILRSDAQGQQPQAVVMSTPVASPAQILQDMRSFRVVASVLHVGAHPDDENTQLIAYLAHGRAFKTGYLSITRGDGGQNLLGPQLGEKLGVARTQELLAARRIDGGQQFFTRAIDYGFSKDYKEALDVWGHQQVLSDVVRVIRTFRPDVIITRFSTEPGGTHGHHTASAVLALEAFKLAGDPKAFPEQLTTLQPWQPKRIFVNGGTQGRGGQDAANAATVTMPINGVDPVNNMSFAAVAALSRGMHKTQGFGQNPAAAAPTVTVTGDRNAPAGQQSANGGAANIQSFMLLDGAPATNSIMDGIDTTWNRIPGGSAITAMADALVKSFNANDPSESVKQLLDIRARVLALAASPLRDEKLKLLDQIIMECVGLQIETTVPHAEYVPNEKLTLHSVATVTSKYPVQWTNTLIPGSMGLGSPDDLSPGIGASREFNLSSIGSDLTQPYWLRETPGRGLYTVNDASMIGNPESPATRTLKQTFLIGGQFITIDDEPVGADTHRRIDVIAPASLHFLPETELFVPATPRSVSVEVVAAHVNTNGTLSLQVPNGWRVTPASMPFNLPRTGDSARIRFTVTPPAQPATANIRAVATVGGSKYSNQRILIDYPHIPRQMLQSPAVLTATSARVAHRGKIVGYVPGAGDFTKEALEQLGYTVVTLNEGQVTAARLKTLDAVVLGIRVLNVRNDLATAMPALFEFAKNGGTVIEQYSQPSGMKYSTLAPFPLTISANDRITDENSAVTFLDPTNAVLNSPNKITASDFENWVQERGSYYAHDWDPKFTPILAGNDPDEAPLKGGLLVARVGTGYFVYTGLSFFRQLPAGNVGAYKLFANLVSLGKNGPVTIE